MSEFLSNLEIDYLRQVIATWKKNNPEYEEYNGVTMGIVNLRMPEEKYNAIMTTNNFQWPKD